MNDLIVVKQLPIIEEQLKTLKESVEKRVADALALEVSEENLKQVKAIRTELKRDFNELEARRKTVKKEVMAPYEAFERVYKDCVSDALDRADTELRNRISSVETEIKMRTEKMLREYFAEATEAAGVPWLKYQQLGIKVGMTDARQKTPKKLMDQIMQTVDRVADDQTAIMAMQDADAIMAEYKTTLSMSTAVRMVQARREAEEQARKMREEQEQAKKEREESGFQPQMLAPPKKEEPVLELRFSVKATKPELVRLKQFLVAGNYQFESI